MAGRRNRTTGVGGARGLFADRRRRRTGTAARRWQADRPLLRALIQTYRAAHSYPIACNPVPFAQTGPGAFAGRQMEPMGTPTFERPDAVDASHEELRARATQALLKLFVATGEAGFCVELDRMRPPVFMLAGNADRIGAMLREVESRDDAVDVVPAPSTYPNTAFSDLLSTTGSGVAFRVTADALRLDALAFHALVNGWLQEAGGDGFTIEQMPKEVYDADLHQRRYVSILLRRDLS